MSGDRNGYQKPGGIIRKLWRAESRLFCDHLLRLDRESRRMRFNHGVSDTFIEDYAACFGETDSIAYAFLKDGDIRAAAELRKRGETWGREAEAAVSVERAYQGQGIGMALMAHIVRAAANRGIRHLVLNCLAGNVRMLAIARRYGADVRSEHGEIVARLAVAGATPQSVFLEAVEDCLDSVVALFGLNERLVRNCGMPFPFQPRVAAG